VDVSERFAIKYLFHGFGLSIGSDLIALRAMVSDPKSIQLYPLFTDPASSCSTGSGKYSFMTWYPVLPLPFSQEPQLSTAFNSSFEFAKENNLD
jgi:hypothetical protein